MPTVVATVGAADANAYRTVAELTAAADRDPFAVATWAAVSDPDERARLAISASALLDSLRYVGERADAAQALQWPRRGVIDPDTGEELPDDALPARLLRAYDRLVFDRAATLAAGAGDPARRVAADDLRRVTAGAVTVEYRDGVESGVAARTAFPPYVLEDLEPFLAFPGSSGRAVRG